MDIELFVLCDAATDAGGKLNILGAFDSIVARTLPLVHPQCAVALRVRFARSEAGKHKIAINMVDADGKSVVPGLNADINVAVKESATSVAANMVMNLQRLSLKEEGEHSIDLAIDGRHEKSIPLTVKKVEDSRSRPPKPN